MTLFLLQHTAGLLGGEATTTWLGSVINIYGVSPSTLALPRSSAPSGLHVL